MVFHLSGTGDAEDGEFSPLKTNLPGETSPFLVVDPAGMAQKVRSGAAQLFPATQFLPRNFPGLGGILSAEERGHGGRGASQRRENFPGLGNGLTAEDGEKLHGDLGAFCSAEDGEKVERWCC